MRTTLTIDDDLAAKLKEKAHRERRTFKEVVNEALEAGLGEQSKPRKRKRFKVVAKDCGFLPGIDTGRLNQLLDELEVDDLIGKSG